MQQAADITGGIYIKIPEPAGLLQFLLVCASHNNMLNILLQWVFLPDVKSRSILQLPRSSVVDYRASCFCDQKLVDTGFVCSVCLASKPPFCEMKLISFVVFCKFMPICPVCQ